MITFYENRNEDFYCRDRREKPSAMHCAAHLHPHIELIVVQEGEVEFFVDTESVLLKSGDVLVIFPNQIHRVDTFDKTHHMCFIINPDLMPELSSVFLDHLPATSYLPGAARSPDVQYLADQLAFEKKEKGPYTEARLRGYLLALFGKLLPLMELSKTVPGDSHALKSVVSYCFKNYTADLSLSTLENELHISRYYISHLFSDKLQMGFNDYINSLRVSFACNYLRHSDKSVTEISDLVGFGTLRTFNRAFLKQMGQTPSEYRRCRQTTSERTGGA
ncbi:MAG: helix-turn-helix domain-containing protein [Clostridia bacterium]|nr:helix-turn-helix domain-containing protein [Clostridia bacterium]